MPGKKGENLFSSEQLGLIDSEPGLGRDINLLAAVLNEYVAPHLPKLSRRGQKRNFLIVGCGPRGFMEAGAASLALGPAIISATDASKTYLSLAKKAFEDIIASLGDKVPKQMAASTITFSQADIFSFVPDDPLDTVFAYGVHPGVVDDGGVDKLIGMAKENGGLVVLTKKSLGEDKNRLEQRLLDRRNEKGDITIVQRVLLTKGPEGSLMDDQYLWVIQRSKK